MGNFKQLQQIQAEIYEAAGSGYIALETLDLPEIEEMIEAGYMDRKDVTAYFYQLLGATGEADHAFYDREWARCRSCGTRQDSEVAVDVCDQCCE